MGHSRQEVWNTEEIWDTEEVWTTEECTPSGGMGYFGGHRRGMEAVERGYGGLYRDSGYNDERTYMDSNN